MKRILFFLLLFVSVFSYGQRNKTETNVTSRWYNVKDYGAKGDSSTDDRAAILRAVTAAGNDSSAIVFFPDGRYVISDSIVIPMGLTLQGTSTGKNSIDAAPSRKYPTGSVIIVNSQTHAGFVINSGDRCCATGVIRPVQIFGLSFLNVSSSTPTSNSAGIRVRQFMQFTLRDMQIQGFYTNLDVIGGDYWTADNCRFADAVQYQMSVGDDILNDAGDQFINNCLFETLLTRQPRADLYYHGGGGIKITNCKFNKWDTDDNNRAIYGILAEMSATTSDFLISNTSIENFDSTAIRINQVGSTIFYNFLIDNVQIATQISKGPAIKIVGNSGDFGMLTLSNYTVNDYNGSANANPWLALTNTNYVNVGVGTVRFYAAASISGGTNIQSLYDPILTQRYLPSFNTTNSQDRIGAIEFQSYALNNATMGENTYYDGSNQKYRATGFASMINHVAGTIYFQTAVSGSAGGNATFSTNVACLNGGTTVLGGAANISSSTTQLAGSESHKYRAITALRTLDATDHIINCTANSFTVTLPTAVGITGREYIIKNTGSATVITIATTSSQTIDGAAPGTITTLVPLRVVSDGANWITF